MLVRINPEYPAERRSPEDQVSVLGWPARRKQVSQEFVEKKNRTAMLAIRSLRRFARLRQENELRAPSRA
jgi:hypothetical protein